MEKKPLMQAGRSGRFLQHGDFTVHLEGRNVVNQMHGPWNAELAEDFWRQAASVISELDETGPWVTTLVITGSAVLSPEGFERIRNRLVQSKGSKRLASAVVIGPDVEGYGLVDEFFIKCHEDVCPMRVFQTIDAAREWLSQFVAVSD